MKLQNFPPVYYISLEESEDRREKLEKQFIENGIVNFKSLISKRFDECDDIVTGKFSDKMKSTTKGAVISHLKNIKRWIEETDDEYAIFFEDDVSFETVDYWNFSWDDFIKELPEDWEAIQLMWIRFGIGVVEFRERFPDDWSAAAFMLTREYGKKLIDKYMINSNEFNFDLGLRVPVVESILYSLGKVYTFPLFVEDVSIPSTFVKSPEFEDNLIKDGQGEFHHESYERISSWWKSVGKRKSLKKLINSQSIFPNTFDWGGFNSELISSFKLEFEKKKIYERYYKIKPNDTVVDIGASVGSFTYSILDKNPKSVYCVEPSRELFGSLVRNTSKFTTKTPIVYINKAISENREDVKVFSGNENVYGGNNNFETIKFKQLIDEYQIEKIDFLKLDCEGGEYDIFNEENIDWILENVSNIAGEFHLTYPGYKDKFVYFRDNFLELFDDYLILTNGNQNISKGHELNITDWIFDKHFFNSFWGELMIYTRS